MSTVNSRPVRANEFKVRLTTQKDLVSKNPIPKKRELLLYATRWTNPSEISQSLKFKYYQIPLISQKQKVKMIWDQR